MEDRRMKKAENENATVEEKPATKGNKGVREMSIERRNYLEEELGVIAGVLDMLFLIDMADAWSNRTDNLGLAILDARHRVESLIDQL